MPEIAEIRNDADDLEFYLTDRFLINIDYNTENFRKNITGLDDIKSALPLTITKVRSKAKKLFFFLNDKLGKQWYIFLTYGMAGKISENEEEHSHIKFELSKHFIGFNTFYYTNARTIASYFEASDNIERFTYHINDMGIQIGIGYSEEGFECISADQFASNIKKSKNSRLLTKIMDQRSICSGIGNYLIAEIFYDAKLDPNTKCSELSDNAIVTLFNSAVKVINESYKNRGMSMADYLNIDGRKGNQSECLKVYGRKITPVGEPVDKLTMNGRTIWYVKQENRK